MAPGALLLSTSALACLGAGNYPGPVRHMREVAGANTVPGTDDAVVVFVRPTGKAPGDQCAVFEIEDRTPTLVGLLGAMKKVAYRVEPGRHLFMVVPFSFMDSAGNADFVTANLDAGKLYYLLLMVDADRRFSLQPVHANEHEQLAERLTQTAWVEKTDDSLSWARQHSEEIEATRFRDYGIWRRKVSFERLALFPDDGR